MKMRVSGIEFNLRTIFVGTLAIVFTIVLGTVAIVGTYLGGGTRMAYWLSWLWSRLIMLCSGVRAEVHGVENLPDDKGGYMLMANHQSHYDILVILSTFPVYIRFIAKVELFSIPIFGRALTQLGHVSIDRRNRESAMRSLGIASKRIRDGMKVLAFPEGTRYNNRNEVGAFKKGAIHLAKQVHTPVVPIWIDNAGDVMRAGSAAVQSGKVHIYIAEPVSRAQVDELEVDQLSQLIRGRIQEQIQIAKQRPGRKP